MKIANILFLFSILFLGFIIRWNGIEKIPYGIEGDEFSMIVTSYFHQYNIPTADKGIWSLFDGMANRFPVPTMITQFSFVIFGHDIISARKMLVMVSLIPLLFFYLLARKFLSGKVSLIILLIYSLSTYKLITSRLVFPSSYSELFAYPSLLLLLSLTRKKPLSACALVFLSGIFAALSVLTANIAYTLPLVSFMIFLYVSITSKFTFRQIIFLVFIFLLPIILTYRIWSNGLQGESSKTYALTHTVLEIKNLKKPQLHLDRLKNNLKTIQNQLFHGLRYETSDMMVGYPAPLINKFVTIAFILGLCIALLKIKQYFPLLVFLGLNGIIYQLLFGFYLPRMWLLTIGSIYLIAGIAINEIYKYLLTIWIRKLSILLPFTLSIVIAIYVFHYEYNLYLKHAINNPSYKVQIREITDFTKTHAQNIGHNLFFVLSNENNNLNFAYAAATFYYPIGSKNDIASLLLKDKEKMGVLSDTDFLSNIAYYKTAENIIFVENQVYNKSKNIFQKENLCPDNDNIYHYFTRISSTKCI